MKNKLMAFLTIIFILIVGCVMFAAADYPADIVEIKEEIAPIVVITKDSECLKPTTIDTSTSPVETLQEYVESNVISTEFPIAAEVWNAMKRKGWTDEVCAGIMGNMMAECGGRTLNLNPYAIGDGGTSFGLCQWHNGRMYNLKNNYGESIEAQINFLEAELGNVESYFSTITDYRQIAYEFCVNFERPTNKEQKGIDRKTLAQTAFEYFSGK